jgi:hypothetical protein
LGSERLIATKWFCDSLLSYLSRQIMSTTPGTQSRKGRGSLGPSNFSRSMSLQPARYAAVTAARSAMIPRMRVETILAARNRARRIVILG